MTATKIPAFDQMIAKYEAFIAENELGDHLALSVYERGGYILPVMIGYIFNGDEMEQGLAHLLLSSSNGDIIVAQHPCGTMSSYRLEDIPRYFAKKIAGFDEEFARMKNIIQGCSLESYLRPTMVRRDDNNGNPTVIPVMQGKMDEESGMLNVRLNDPPCTKSLQIEFSPDVRDSCTVREIKESFIESY